MIFRHLLNMRSHPTWVRGLKQHNLNFEQTQKHVAPYVGAWIETAQQPQGTESKRVAPSVGAWIETSTS